MVHAMIMIRNVTATTQSALISNHGEMPCKLIHTIVHPTAVEVPNMTSCSKLFLHIILLLLLSIDIHHSIVDKTTNTILSSSCFLGCTWFLID